ncbi:hypothetical protein [Tolypothrix sp. VBCCA 56010]|uniref:hypothetical protein n=1 Tax=Tolypothrix sp. VBCCA 56010 TaxID=3137731 RepID=UPI003D7CCD38
MHFNKGVIKIESRTTDAKVRAYLSLQQIIGDLYAEADNAEQKEIIQKINPPLRYLGGDL